LINKVGEPIAGANGPSHTTNRAGTYYVVAENDAGSDMSNWVALTVLTVPVITEQPQDADAEGNSATLSVKATGGELVYTWYLIPEIGWPIVYASGPSMTVNFQDNVFILRFFVVVKNKLGEQPSVTATVRFLVIE
jgi:hypothetical protein